MKTDKELTHIIYGVSTALGEQLQELDLTLIESCKVLMSTMGVILGGIGESFPEDCREEFGTMLLHMTSMLVSNVIQQTVTDKNFMNKHMEAVYETLKNKNNNQTIH